MLSAVARCRPMRIMKNKKPVVENAQHSDGNHHRNHSAETTTTAPSAETTTTLDISGGVSRHRLERPRVPQA